MGRRGKGEQSEREGVEKAIQMSGNEGEREDWIGRGRKICGKDEEGNG